MFVILYQTTLHNIPEDSHPGLYKFTLLSELPDSCGNEVKKKYCIGNPEGETKSF
jgi:hypothetical protein